MYIIIHGKGILPFNRRCAKPGREFTLQMSEPNSLIHSSIDQSIESFSAFGLFMSSDPKPCVGFNPHEVRQLFFYALCQFYFI